MSARDAVRLVVLSAIWGGSFPIMRVVAPALGPVPTACLRLLIGGGVLLAWFRWRGTEIAWRAHWKQYAVIGVVNSGIPFLLFCLAALVLPAAYSAVLNSLSPPVAMALSVVLFRERVRWTQWLGVVIAVGGVALLVGFGPIAMDGYKWLAAAGCVLGTSCYAVAGMYMKRRATALSPYAIAAASQLSGSLFLAGPSVVWAPTEFSLTVLGLVIVLGLVCSGVAYVLYFRLVADCGVVNALTVTFLIPIFGILWAALFLGEPLTWAILAGCGVVVAGTYLVVRGT